MKILMIYPYLIPSGGVERHIIELSDYLTTMGHKVIIISFRMNKTLLRVYPPEGIVHYRIEENGNWERIGQTVVIHVVLPKYYDLLSFAKGSYLNLLAIAYFLSRVIRRIAKKVRIDRIYACEAAAIIASYFAGQVLRRSANFKMIASLHTGYNFRHRIVSRIFIHILTKFDAVALANINENTYKRLSNNLGHRLKITPNWVDDKRFKPRHVQKLSLRRAYGIPSRYLVFLYVARLVPPKNPLNVLRAFHLLLSKTGWDNLLLIIVGQGMLESEIDKYVRQHNLLKHVLRMKPIPHTSDQYPILYNIADAFILVPFHEGLSVVVLEALASGLPVIYSNVSGIPKDISEVIYLTNPHCIKDIYLKMKYLLLKSHNWKDSARMRAAISRFLMSQALPKIAELIIS